MAIQKSEKIVKKDDKSASSKPAAADKNKALSAEDLDKVSGGLNPQPLPPIERQRL